jgi:KaiC/GvpD/RAD55 family RecA-like ATPase
MEVRSPRMKRSTKLFERLLDTDVKADLLTLFHNNGNLQETSEGLAKNIGRTATEVERELEDLVQLGILRKEQVYSFAAERDREIQDAISKQLALGELPDGPQLEATAASPIQIPKMPCGIEVLDKVLPDGIPLAGTTLILSDPGAGEENLVAHFVSQFLKSGKSVIYVTLDNFPPNIRQITQSHSTEVLDWASLIFVDCYSKTVGVESDESYVVDPENLSAVSIAIADIMSKKTILLVVIDSFNTLIRKRGLRSAIELLRVLVARTRQAKCLCFATMNRKAFHPAIVASSQDIVDGVIELKTEEGAEGIERSLRALKMLGTRHLTSWVPYDVSDQGKLVPASPRKKS